MLPSLKEQLAVLNIDYDIYVTAGVGDGTRYVRMFCEFHPSGDYCFVSCGGSGTANEVAAGIVATKSTYPMAIMKFSNPNNLLKFFPERNFWSVKDMINGTPVQIDAIKCNDNYAINTLSIGFGAKWGPLNRLKVFVDGKKIGGWLTFSCRISNGTALGGLNDGFMDVCAFKFKYTGKCVRGKHVLISSGEDLSYVSLDGELDVATEFRIDVIEKAVTLILPAEKK